MTFSLPSATPEVLTGDVLERQGGVWRIIRTASGFTVHDGFKVPRDWRDDIDAARYQFGYARASKAYKAPPTQTGYGITWDDIVSMYDKLGRFR